MTRGANSGAPAASVPPAEHVSFTDRGDLVVRVPAGLVRLAVALAALVGLVAVSFVAATVAALPLALVGVSAVVAAVLFAPFAAVALAAALLE